MSPESKTPACKAPFDLEFDRQIDVEIDVEIVSDVEAPEFDLSDPTEASTALPDFFDLPPLPRYERFPLDAPTPPPAAAAMPTPPTLAAVPMPTPTPPTLAAVPMPTPSTAAAPSPFAPAPSSSGTSIKETASAASPPRPRLVDLDKTPITPLPPRTPTVTPTPSWPSTKGRISRYEPKSAQASKFVMSELSSQSMPSLGPHLVDSDLICAILDIARIPYRYSAEPASDRIGVYSTFPGPGPSWYLQFTKEGKFFVMGVA